MKQDTNSLTFETKNHGAVILKPTYRSESCEAFYEMYDSEENYLGFFLPPGDYEDSLSAMSVPVTADMIDAALTMAEFNPESGELEPWYENEEELLDELSKYEEHDSIND